MLLHPARGPLRVMAASFGMISTAMTKILGAQIWATSDPIARSRHFSAGSGSGPSTFNCCRRGWHVPGCCNPSMTLQEAAYFVANHQEGMPLSGMV
jgi:hypothetical protein